MNEKFVRAAKKYKDEIIKTAQELIQIESVSLNEGRIAKYLENKLNLLGYDEVETDRYGNVFGIMRGTGGGSSVMLNCHMDTVEPGDAARWQHEPFSGEIADGRIWGRGASDTKGTMALYLYIPVILKELGQLPKGDIVIAEVISEEIAGFGAMVHTDEGRMLTDYAVLGEASENDIAIGSRGRCCAVITITGKSCHASQPYNGCNPCDYLALLLPELKKVEMSSDELFGSSNMSVTRITTSEEGTNIIPSETVVYVDYRMSGSDNQESVKSKLEKAAAAVEMDGIDVKVEILYFPLTTYTGVTGMGYQGEDPFRASTDADYIIQAKSAVEAAVGHEVRLKPWAFATDAGHYAKYGVRVLGYSPAEIRLCHSCEDSISIEMLEEGIVGTLAIAAALANNEKSGNG